MLGFANKNGGKEKKMKFRLVEPLVCPICGAEFETEEMVKMHLMTRHSEEELRKAVSVIE
ncbi:hypothetical protein CW713_10445 [Methanophagales archaeon]|nr:MAG: hypothetical protein CW713_10445 [Methanophagales archaeon]RLG32881.1 MAG: hypothetical protein DRN97_06375 [Methanosarcinales archaeon]